MWQSTCNYEVLLTNCTTRGALTAWICTRRLSHANSRGRPKNEVVRFLVKHGYAGRGGTVLAGLAFDGLAIYGAGKLVRRYRLTYNVGSWHDLTRLDPRAPLPIAAGSLEGVNHEH
jgi:hypothetical protein